MSVHRCENDDREAILGLLGGRKVDRGIPLGGLVAALVPSVLPTPVSLAEAARRLLHALRKADVRTFREVLKSGAEGDGWALARVAEKADIGPGDVERVLEEADRLATSLVERGERMRRRGVATMLKSSDPGARREAGCSTCGVPRLIGVDFSRRIQSGEGWFILVGRE